MNGRYEEGLASVTEAASIIQEYLVNRRDRYGHHYKPELGPKAGTIQRYLAPPPWVIAGAKAKGKIPPFLGQHQLTDHVEHRGLPVGVLAISKSDTCKWIAWDIDRHGDDIPYELPEAARDAIVEFVEETLHLKCIVENSGGGWHIWLPLAEAAYSQQAYEVVQAVCAIGEEAWRALDGMGAKVEGYPKAPTHSNGGKNCGGNWLRLPGKHHTRDHVSFIILPDGQVIDGLAMWQHFKNVAELNTVEKWETAYAKVVALRPRPVVKKKPEIARRGRVGMKVAPPDRVKTAAKPNVSYTGWPVEKLVTEALRRGERFEREKALVWTILREGGTSEDAIDAISRLYCTATGDSADLADPARRSQLILDIPNMVARFSRHVAYCWASQEESDRGRDLLIARTRELQRSGVPGWSADSFARWFDGFCAFAQTRAQAGGYNFLAKTIIRATRTQNSHDQNKFFLRDNGGARPGLSLTIDFCGEARHHLNHTIGPKVDLCPRKVTAYIAYLYLLATTPSNQTGHTAVRIARSAKRGKSPWCLDLSALPLVQPL
jgi:hypothetical protein